MPIEIREIVIRTVVGGAAAQPEERVDIPPSAQPANGIDLDLLVQECVRQVLQVLARDRER